MTTTIAPARPAKLRLAACMATVLGTVPYLTLKISWLTGGTIGPTDPSFVDSSTVWLGNLVTAGMDAVAILLACALTFAWGRRIPAPLVLFPAWVGAGLLTPIVLISPVIAADLATSPPTGMPLESWVWGVVYGGFAWQGVTLLTAFVLYVRDRWPGLPTSLRPQTPWIVAAVAMATACLHLAWAFGSTFAHPPIGSLSGHVLEAAFGVLAALAVLALSTPGRLWPRLIVGWTGTGAMFGWGGWTLFSTLTGGATGLEALVCVAQIGAALFLVRSLLTAVRQAT
ncbi:MAG TPA: hypothetical protein VJX66_11630 [Amycolatopsis sp.]|nr:hypothetical protein [Amycolatopsis sp.]